MAKKDPKVSDTVTYSQTFAAVMQRRDEKLVPVVKSQRWFHHQMNKFKEGEEVTLMVHNRRPKRSEQQNRYYWGVYLPLISKETGEADIDALHELFKGKFLTEGVVEVLGNKVRKKRSTTELGVAEFCQFIMDIETLTQVAAPPTESYGLAPLRSDIEKSDESQA
jgi:hypothetical protein